MAMEKWKERVRECQHRKDHSFSITRHPTTIKKEIKKQSNFILFFFFFLFSKPNFLFLSPKPTHIHSKSKQSKFPSFQEESFWLKVSVWLRPKPNWPLSWRSPHQNKDDVTSTHLHHNPSSHFHWGCVPSLSSASHTFNFTQPFSLPIKHKQTKKTKNISL